MRELDLYSGLPQAEPVPPETPEPEPGVPSTGDRARRASSSGDSLSGGSASDRPDDWIHSLWRGFQPAIRERFEPRAMIGEGGMGVVIEAHDRLMDRPVAIKGPRDPGSMSADTRARQLLEAQIAARLAHPNILPVFDLWTDSRGNPWCSMLRVPGAAPTLAGHLTKLEGVAVDKRPLVQLLRTFLEVCRAIAWAHSAGYLHRDIKPENVFLGETGEALVADWGVATKLEEARNGTRDRVGTRGYAAPEQLGMGGPARADERADVYSLGVLLYEMLVGQRYARLSSSASSSQGSYGDEVPEGPDIPELMPRELAAIIRRATAWNPRDRHADVKSLMREIDHYQMGGVIDGFEYCFRERVRKFVQRHPLQAGVAMTALLAAVVVVAMLLGLRKQHLMLRKRLAQVYAEKASSAREKHDQDLALHYSAMALHTWPQQYVLPNPVPYTVLAEGRGRGRHLWSQRLSAPSTCVAFGPDGRTVAVAGKDGGVELWDVQRGALSRTLVPGGTSSGRVLSLGFARSGRLAAAGEDGVVRVWEPDGRELPAMPGHTKSVHSVAISTDGQMIASAGDDDTVRLWGLDGVKPPVTKLDMRTMGAGSLALDRDLEKLFLAAHDDSLSMLDVGVRDSKQFPIEMLDRRLIGHIKPVEGGLRHVNYMPAQTEGGEQLVAFSAAAPETCALVQLWDLTYWRDAGRLHHERRITSVCIVRAPPAPGDLRGRASLCSASEDGVIRVWDTDKRVVKIELTGHQGAVTALAPSPDGRLLASVGVDGSLRIWDIETGFRRLGIYRPGRQPSEIAFTPDRSQLVEMTHGEGKVTTFDAFTRRRLGEEARALGAARSLASSPDGRRVAVLLPGRVAVFDLRVEGGRAQLVNAGSTPVTAGVRALGFTAGGRPLVVERTPAGFAVRDLAGGKVISELVWPPEPRPGKERLGEPTALAVGPGAERLLLLGSDRLAYMWEPARTGRTAEPYSTVTGVTAIAMAPGTDATALGDERGSVFVWPTGRNRAVVLNAHLSPVHALVCSADGRSLASRGDEPVIRSWDLTAYGDPDEVLEQLRATSPFRFDGNEMSLVAREQFHPRPWFPADYRFPQEGSR